MKNTLKILTVLFFFVFTTLFVLTFLTPKSIEESAESFIKKEIESEVKSMMIKQRISSTINFAFNVGEKLGFKSKNEQLIKLIAPELPELIEIIVAYKLTYTIDDSRYKKLALFSKNHIAKFKIGEKQLDLLIEEKYEEIKINLKNDLRIFSGINAILFLFVSLLFFIQKPIGKELLLLSTLLLSSALLSSLIYVFGQDWIYIMVYNKYLGFGYFIYVAILFTMILDIVYNGGRITLTVLKIISGAIKSIVEIALGLLGA
ncbi:hypothetical protein [Aureispira anguillae]|uniref:Uncharacterized protein n=1 Tax=Aureispira anguillae TaxID=2864201 RepID=A0A916DQX7_9BACT|nr:hypothetical protein [Aureispira anguillae]BDS11454.1 hypothetical protein AsAng_0021680 [Aureispira anguillae]